jgi:hypothetical protein
MKLTRITKPPRSVQVRITFDGALHTTLGNYARYYQQVHGDEVEPRALIPEMIRAFMDTDREFQSWSRSLSNGRESRAAAAPSASAAPKTPA